MAITSTMTSTLVARGAPGLQAASNAVARITTPPPTLTGWVAMFHHADLPVLASTADALEELRSNEDAVDAHLLAATINEDPLMTLKLLGHVAALRRTRVGHGGVWRDGGDTETVTQALVMLGIPPFFRAFGRQPTVEAALAGDPVAQAGFAQVLQRARRAGRFAMGFAVHRMDHDAAVLHEAALLNDFAELLLWLRAPSLAAQMQLRLRANSTLRSAPVQRDVLYITLSDLEHALMQAWQLPQLLVEITDAQAPARNAQVRNVQLAIRIARHSALDWDNAALPDDVHDLAALLNLAPDAALRLLREIDED